MKHLAKFAVIGFSVQLLNACGGGSEGSAPEPATPRPVSAPSITPLQTADIKAESNFDFRVDSTITLSLGEAPPGRGVVNIYHTTEYYDQTLDKLSKFSAVSSY